MRSFAALLDSNTEMTKTSPRCCVVGHVTWFMLLSFLCQIDTVQIQLLIYGTIPLALKFQNDKKRAAMATTV